MASAYYRSALTLTYHFHIFSSPARAVFRVRAACLCCWCYLMTADADEEGHAIQGDRLLTSGPGISLYCSGRILG